MPNGVRMVESGLAAYGYSGCAVRSVVMDGRSSADAGEAPVHIVVAR